MKQTLNFQKSSFEQDKKEKINQMKEYPDTLLYCDYET